MFVISRFVYDAMAKSKIHSTNPYLVIHDYADGNHKQTFYRFRYGAVKSDKRPEPAPVQVRKGAAVPIWSLEGFELSERVLGIFGHASDLFLRGLELVHSPFIDPSFKGRLELVVRNMSDRDVTLVPGEVVGKIMFFDISDSILSAEDLLADVQKSARNSVRESALNEMAQAMGRIGKE